MRECEVVVVGGGVVGSSLTLALRQRGLEAVLIERGQEPPAFHPEAYDARVYALAPAAARFLEGLGAWTAVLARRACAYREMRVWEDDTRNELRFSAAELARHELGWIVENQVLLATLRERLPPEAVLMGVQVADCALDTGTPELQLSDGQRWRSRLIVSAEGADALLRERSGIEAPGWTYDQRAIVCHVATDVPHRATAWQRFLNTGPLAFLPLADGRSSIVWSVPEAHARQLLDLDDGAFSAALGDAFEGRLGSVSNPTPRQSFPLRALHAERYVRPGIALLGDSAHVIHPLAGQGLNLGLGDAARLTEVLAEAHHAGRRLGSERVLKRYERQRRAANAEMLVVTDALQRMFSIDFPGWSAMRRFGLGAVNRLPFLKNPLARRAMGMDGR